MSKGVSTFRLDLKKLFSLDLLVRQACQVNSGFVCSEDSLRYLFASSLFFTPFVFRVPGLAPSMSVVIKFRAKLYY